MLLTELGHDWYLFDLLEQGIAGRSSAYLYNGPQKILVETGSAPCLPQIIQALAALSLTPSDLTYVVVTHIHLDHAGGAGQLAALAPQATFVAHKRAARHLIDPTRLVAGAKTVYGPEAFATLFGEVLPVPASQVLIRENGDTLSFGDRDVVFFDTPGHAKHHFSMFDPVASAIFAGDALGIRYVKQFTAWDFECILPSSSPTDFDPLGVVHTVDTLRTLSARFVYHTHFGPSPAEEALHDTLEGTQLFTHLIDSLWEPTLRWETVADALQESIYRYLERKGYPVAGLSMTDLGIDIELDAKGLLYYAQTRATTDKS